MRNKQDQISEEHKPGREETDDGTLGLSTEPLLALDVRLNLLQVHLENLWRESSNEMFCKRLNVLFKRLRQL